MANRQLIILRHGEAELGAGIDDFDRMLTARGESDAGIIGKWLGDKSLLPGRILSSPAARAVATAELAAAACGVEPDIIRFDRRMYLASIEDLFAIVEATPAGCNCLILVGHNPGLETLLDSLVGPGQLSDYSGGQMAPASVAVIDLTIEWTAIGVGTGQLNAFVSPSELRK
jgi:phosphohistidine phosphatase